MSGNSPHRNSSVPRIVFGLLALLTCLRVWLGPMVLVEPAQAQIPDSGLQRKLLLDEARRTNRLLSDIKQILAVGALNVRIVGADNTGTDNTAGEAGTVPRP